MKKEYKSHIAAVLLIIVIIFLLIFTGCGTKIMYVPVETIKTEYKDKMIRDSVYMHDSVFYKIADDTVWIEKYRYMYRDKIVRDSIFRTDSIQVPYPVEVEKEVNRLSSFQSFQVWCGRILLIALFIGLLIIKIRIK